MYYHCRPLKFVEYGKVFPPPEDTIDEEMLNVYKWLGKHCGYCPQIWLSRSCSSITGFRGAMWERRWFKKNRQNGVLFGFENIKGFPVDYGIWEYILGLLFDEPSDNDIVEYLNTNLDEAIKHGYLDEDGVSKKWNDCDQDFEKFLHKYLFVEVDQVVLPSLNLKAAKKVICRNEKQKKKLLKMGFIEDRVQIKNIKNWK